MKHVLVAIAVLALAPALLHADTFEPNDTQAEAHGPLSSGLPLESFLATAADLDWFWFDAAPGDVAVTLTDLPAGVDYDLFLVDDEGNFISSSQQEGNAAETIDDVTLFQNERLWILVESVSGGSDVESYTLTAGFTPPPVNELPVVALLSPRGGEVWTAGTVHPITWSAVDPEDGTDLDIELQWRASSGALWTSLATTTNTGSWNWLVPAEDTDQAMVRVIASDMDGGATADTSQSVFTIEPVPNQAPAVTVLSPDGGETWTGGAEEAITWLAEDLEDGSDLSIDVLLSLDGGASWDTLALDTDNDGSQAYPVPEALTDSVLARVVAHDTGDLTATDTSDGFASITPSAGPGSLTATAEDASADSGSPGTVALSVNRSSVLGLLSISVDVDATHLVFDDAVPGGDADGLTVTVSNPDDGRTILTWTAPEHDPLPAGTGILARVTYLANSVVTRDVAVDLEILDARDPFGRAVAATAVDGTFEILAVAANATLALPAAVTAAPGSAASVPVTFISNVSVTQLSFDAVYDPLLLSPTAHAQGPRTAGMDMTTTVLEAGRLRVEFTFADASVLAPGAGLATALGFSVDPAATANGILSLENPTATDGDGKIIAVGTDHTGLTPILALSLHAETVDTGARVFWNATVEGSLTGFRVLRDGRPIHNGWLPESSRSILDRTAPPGATVSYELESLDRSGGSQRFGPVRLTLPGVTLWAGTPFPNPSRRAIRMDVRGRVLSADVIDVRGRRVATLTVPRHATGQVQWDGRAASGNAAPAGLYFVRLTGTDGTLVRRIMRVR